MAAFLLLKAVKIIGMSVVRDRDELAGAWERVSALGRRFFGNSGVLLERYMPSARHIELQILCSTDGEVVMLGGRDCSVQRRHQKIVEESPPAGSSRADGCDDRRCWTGGAGDRLSRSRDHRVSRRRCVRRLRVPGNEHRLQVEHPVTELVTGIDLVEQQILVAAGAPPASIPPPSSSAATRSSSGSTRRTRSASSHPRARSRSGASRWGRASGWMPDIASATRSRPITTRCLRRSAPSAKTGNMRSHAVRMRLPNALWQVCGPISISCADWCGTRFHRRPI